MKSLFKNIAVSALTLPLLVTGLPVNAAIIESFDGSKMPHKSLGSGGDNVFIVKTPARDTGSAYKHTISGGYRSETSFKKTEIGSIYWYGWSTYIPLEYKNPAKFHMIAQHHSYPSKRDGKFPCGGGGHRLDIRSNGDIVYSNQYKGKTKDMECTKQTISKLNDLKGKWVDFVQHVKWTGNSDGFMKLWMRIGDGEYKQVINYKGATWWNDESKAPYLKLGLYSGSGNKGKANATVYIDEYKLGDEKSSLEEVSPS